MKANIKRSWFALRAKSKYEKSLLKSTYPGDFDPPKEKHFQSILLALQGSTRKTNAGVAFSLLINRLQAENWSSVLKAELIIHRSLEYIDITLLSRVSELSLSLGAFYDSSERGRSHSKLIQSYYLYIVNYASNISRKHSVMTKPGIKRLQYAKSMNNTDILIEGEFLMNQLHALVKVGPECKEPAKKYYFKVTRSVIYWVLHDASAIYTTTAMVLKELELRFFSYQPGDAKTVFNMYKLFYHCTNLLKDFFDLATWYELTGLARPSFENRKMNVMLAMEEYAFSDVNSAVVKIQGHIDDSEDSEKPCGAFECLYDISVEESKTSEGFNPVKSARGSNLGEDFIDTVEDTGDIRRSIEYTRVSTPPEHEESIE